MDAAPGDPPIDLLDRDLTHGGFDLAAGEAILVETCAGLDLLGLEASPVRHECVGAGEGQGAIRPQGDDHQRRAGPPGERARELVAEARTRLDLGGVDGEPGFEANARRNGLSPTRIRKTVDTDFRDGGVRVVPPATARKGAYIAPSCVLMPSYVNIGAYVDSGTMVDTWATVGSCAQIGKNVHLSGGVGIGGVLEPLQAAPTIIEDNCFIGARSEVVEGVIVEEGSVISMGVYIGQSTRIYDREKDEIIYGRVPAGSVVVSGNLPSKDGKYSLYCAVIVKRVDERTRSKVGINELLRDI